MTDDRLLAAAAAGSLGSEAEHRALLQLSLIHI